MRQILFLAVAALVAGGYLARYADKTVGEPTPQAATVQIGRTADAVLGRPAQNGAVDRP